MNKVAIVTDSSVSLPQELIEKYGIRLVPLSIIFGGKVYRDRLDLSTSDFYRFMRQSQEIPTTSAPSPQLFLQAFEEANREANGIACILMSSAMTQMTHNSALIAKEAIKERLPSLSIEIIDSRTVVGAFGLIALSAAKEASQGQKLAQVIRAAEETRKQVTIVAALDTLKYLAKGGRIGKAASWAGNLLDIKAILEVPTSTGVVEPIQRVRTKNKALERLVKIMEERVGNKRVHVIIDHGDILEEAEWLKETVSSQFNCDEIYISGCSPVVGVHPGPGLVGLSFYAEP